LVLIADPDSDPAFYLSADPEPDPDPGSQTNADPCGSGSWSDFAVIKSLILTGKIYSMWVFWHVIKTYLRKYKSHFERLEVEILASLLLDLRY
jgi:hypothetical protein